MLYEQFHQVFFDMDPFSVLTDVQDCFYTWCL